MVRRVPMRCGLRFVLAGITLLAVGLAAIRRRSSGGESPTAIGGLKLTPRSMEGTAKPNEVTGCLEYEQATLVAARRQAWGTVVGAIAGAAALLVSLGAFFVAMRTWQSQTEHEERVYSGQVALWATVGLDASSVLPAGLDVHVQNLAPVPMHQARIVAALASGGMAEGLIGDMQPCTVQSFRVAPPAGQTFVKGEEQWLGYTDLVLEFVENSHTWRLTNGGLESLPMSPRSGGLPQLVQANYQRIPASNCGSGG